MSAPGVTTSDLQKKDVQAFTAATAPRAAEYGPFPALIDGIVYRSNGISNDAFPMGWTQYSAMPVMSRPVLGMIGDSITNNGWQNGAYSPNTLGSINMQAAKASNYAFLCGASQGTGGHTVAQLLAAMDAYAPMTDDIVTHIAVLIGTNDSGLATPTPVATFIATLKQVYDKILAKGKVPVACMLPPRNTSTANIIYAILSYNNAIAQLAAQYEIPCADLFTTCCDFTAATGTMQWKANYNRSGDLVHPTFPGVAAMGAELAKAMLPLCGGSAAQLIPPFSAPYQLGTAEGYPYANGLFQTITGTINLAGSQPSAPWNGNITGTPTHTVFSLASDPGAGAYGQSNIWEISAADANTFFTVRTDGAPMSNFGAAGDLIAVFLNFKYTKGSQGIANAVGFQIGVRDTAAIGARVLSYEQMSTATESSADESGRIVLIRRLPAGFSGNLCWYIQSNKSAGATGVKLALANTGVINLTRAGLA